MNSPDMVGQDKPEFTATGQVDVAPEPGVPRSPLWRWGGIAFVTVLASVFGPSLSKLAVHVVHTELHSYIILVPFIAAYLIYIRLQELPKHHSSSPLLAVIPLAVGFAAWFIAHNVRSLSLSEHDRLAVLAFALVCCLVGGGFLFLGGAWMRAAAFPMFFLLFLVPLPNAVVELLETGSKLGSAETADLFFTISGVPFLRDGTVFQLPGIALEVARECSGIRSSWVLFITSLLVSNLFLRTPWRRTVLVLFVIPLGLLRNGFRILVIGLLCVQIGPEMIESIVHRRGGPLFFALSLIPLFALLWWLRAGERKKGTRKLEKN
jgi:exosortase C (VPDSG-CTERM-specific)